MLHICCLDIESVVELDNVHFSDRGRPKSRAQPPSWDYFFQVKVKE